MYTFINIAAGVQQFCHESGCTKSQCSSCIIFHIHIGSNPKFTARIKYKIWVFYIISTIKCPVFKSFSKLWLRIFKKLKNSLIINSYAWLVTPQYLFNYRFIFSLKSYGTSHEKNISGIFCMVETFILYRSFFNWRIYCFATRYYHTVQPKNRTLVGIFLRLSLL